uniref:Putative ovule protein n=1 Tax=Solanum chacoense TaxID=4108 RepID=A0A0V0GPN3_SOLCH
MISVLRCYRLLLHYLVTNFKSIDSFNNSDTECLSPLTSKNHSVFFFSTKKVLVNETNSLNSISTKHLV